MYIEKEINIIRGKKGERATKDGRERRIKGHPSPSSSSAAPREKEAAAVAEANTQHQHI